MNESTTIQNCEATVVRQVDYTTECKKIVLQVPDRVQIRAGQFCHILADFTTEPLLRRPFSFWDVRPGDGEQSEIELLYTVVGAGTELLSKRRPGERVGYLGPLGNGFTPSDASTYVFVAGGVGIVPFYIFAKQLFASGKKPRILLLFGGRSEPMLYGIDDFPEIGVETFAATEDGSRGKQGLVTALLEEWLGKIDKSDTMLYTCGPDAMMAAVTKIARRESLPAEVCMERRMGCALGACAACVMKRREGTDDWRYSRICIEGPVYDADEWVLE